MRRVGSPSPIDFKAKGQHLLDILIQVGRLRPTDRVLDVGCGCGRVALPLSSYLTTGSYEGVDIDRDAMEWCKRNITQRRPTFNFELLVDVHNSAYNSQGRRQASDYAFPYPDESFDFTVLTSVFTHMLPRDVEHYAREIARTLKPEGRAMITFFILNQESEQLITTSASRFSFAHWHSDGQVRVEHSTDPEAAVAYPEPRVRCVLQQAGLTIIEPIYWGSWCGRKNTVTVQDLTLSVKGQPAILQSDLHNLWNPWSWRLFRPLRNLARKRKRPREGN